jgi:hypothetical protein
VTNDLANVRKQTAITWDNKKLSTDNCYIQNGKINPKEYLYLTEECKSSNADTTQTIN